MAKWEETVLSPERLKQIALDSFGTRDGIRPLMPKKGEDIQEAMEDVANHQSQATWHSRDNEVAEARKEGREQVMADIASLSLESGDKNLRGYAVGLLEQLHSKYAKLKEWGL
jgi:hypothetical protein